MVSNFPIPYQDELIYSVIARYAIHQGILSPKFLMEELFNKRNLTPTYDLPNHLDKLASYLPDRYDALSLIRQHTLFSIYAPFQSSTITNYVLEALCGEQSLPIHTKLGKNASLIKSVNFFRFCPHCWQEQIKHYGEVYWKRIWQITGYEYCTRHQHPLYLSSIPCNGLDRKYYVAHMSAIQHSSQLILNPQDYKHHIELAKLIEELISHSDQIDIQDFSIISNAYFIFLKDLGLLAGNKQINYKKISQLVVDYWGESFLQYYNLGNLYSIDCWLKKICRKHRKAFSYIEHLIFLKALLPEQNPILIYQQYLKQATTKITQKTIQPPMQSTMDHPLSEDQLQWMQLIQKMSVKPARKYNAALYARLYRNHKDWLLDTNQTAVIAPSSPVKPRIDWTSRDRYFVKQLVKIRNELWEDLDCPQMTKKFLIKQLGHVSTIEKNWDILPLTKAFLDRYSESVSCYQIRRLTRTFINQRMRQQFSSPSIFLRESGLSPQRLTPEALRFFNKIMGQ